MARYARQFVVRQVGGVGLRIRTNTLESRRESLPTYATEPVTHKELAEIEKQIREATAKHNAFLRELGLSPLPGSE